jgi:hypothetical protein
MYTETLPGDQALALIIPYLSESMAGMYYCSASYANTEPLEIGVKIETYGEYNYTISTILYNDKTINVIGPAPAVHSNFHSIKKVRSIVRSNVDVHNRVSYVYV